MVDPLRTLLLESLPDDPLHVEVRGLLLGLAELKVIGDPRAPERAGLVFAPRFGLAVGYGAPPTSLMAGLRAAASKSGHGRDGVKLHLPMECAGAWLAMDGVTSTGQNLVRALRAPASWELAAGLIRHDIRVLPEASDPLLETLPPDLAAEFAVLRPWPPVVCALDQDRITSIAYAFVETETYFDLSIDTIQFYRREGCGTSCAAALIRRQIARGKSPVWIAPERSTASLALSNRLGFEDSGRVQAALFK